jgi:hypothetical protein
MRRPSPASLPLAAAFVFAACQGAPAPVPLAGEPGRGVVAADTSAPAGAVTWPRPEWRVGDTFTLVRGKVVRGTFTVERADDAGYVLGTGGSMNLHRDRDLGNLGEWPAEGDQPLHLLDPVDARFHWPLWVGKRWSCEFVDKALGGDALAMHADYVVEDLDSVTVPAGTFEALRVVRTVRLLATDQPHLHRTQITWYAPSIGAEVRQILGDTEVELVEHRRGS